MANAQIRIHVEQVESCQGNNMISIKIRARSTKPLLLCVGLLSLKSGPDMPSMAQVDSMLQPLKRVLHVGGLRITWYFPAVWL